jgi:flagellar assembly protein FliH
MASVIKASPSTSAIQQIAFNFEDLTLQASKYLEQTRIQAAQIVVEAQKQADLIKAKSQEEGRKSAQVAAEKTLDEKVGQRMTTLLPALSKVVADLQDAKQAWLRQWEEAGVQLAARMAEKILRRELSQEPSASMALMREALELASGATKARVLLNPNDLAALGKQTDRLANEFSRISQVEFVADSSISTGGCRVLTEQGEIDQRIEVQLERLVSELVGGNAD